MVFTHHGCPKQDKKNHRMEETEAGKNNNNTCNHTIINDNQPLEKNLNN
jgi:hypothetical protein